MKSKQKSIWTCPVCGAETYRSRGGKDICTKCDYKTGPFGRLFGLWQKPRAKLLSSAQPAFHNTTVNEGEKDLSMMDAFVKAAQNGNLTFLKDMISKGIDVNAKDQNKWTALIMASYNGHADAAKLLLDSGADPNLPSWTGETAVMRAAVSGHVQIVRLLFDRGANLNAKDKDGMTAVMRASFTGQRSVVEFLLAKGADVNARDNRGHTAWTFASDRGHNELLRDLEKYGKISGITIDSPPPKPKDPWVESRMIVHELQSDYGVVVYRDENDDVKVSVLNEAASREPLSNPEVEKLLKALRAYPKQVLRSSVQTFVLPEYKIKEV